MDERHNFYVMRINYFWSMLGVRRMDRWRKREVRRRVYVSEETSDRVDWKVLKGFGHVEYMS